MNFHRPSVLSRLVHSRRFRKGISMLRLRRPNETWLIVFLSSTIVAADCVSKFTDLRSAGGQEQGGTDNHGNPVNIANATAMTYALCLKTCGTGPSFRPWSVFSQRFSTWLLPFLALVCQLPFGANNRLENAMSMILNVGSPTLAAYSIMLTLLNGHWISQRFTHIAYPNARNAVRILISLQHIPLQVTTDHSLLGSLIVLPENDQWWSNLVVWLDLNYAYSWSLANVASIAWVIVAFVLTVIDTFTNVTNNATPPLNSNGLAVAHAWLWLLPIVISWLQIAPRCDRGSLHRALRHANGAAYIAGPGQDEDPIRTDRSAISSPRRYNPGGADAYRTPPIYHYSRILHWDRAVEAVYSAFNEASCRSAQHIPVQPETRWIEGEEIKAQNRRGSADQVSNYVSAHPKIGHPQRRAVSSRVVLRMMISSILANVLIWGTVSAAIIIQWFTPTIGLSCRSGSYLLYACVSTLVWLMLVISSVLAVEMSHSLTRLAIVLRRGGKLLASMNAIWIVLICLFQFTGLYDTCWCTSSMLYLGSRAYSVTILTPSDIDAFWYPLVGGTILASGSVIIFVVCTNLLLDPQIGP